MSEYIGKWIRVSYTGKEIQGKCMAFAYDPGTSDDEYTIGWMILVDTGNHKATSLWVSAETDSSVEIEIIEPPRPRAVGGGGA